MQGKPVDRAGREGVRRGGEGEDDGSAAEHLSIVLSEPVARLKLPYISFFQKLLYNHSTSYRERPPRTGSRQF